MLQLFHSLEFAVLFDLPRSLLGLCKKRRLASGTAPYAHGFLDTCLLEEVTKEAACSCVSTYLNYNSFSPSLNLLKRELRVFGIASFSQTLSVHHCTVFFFFSLPTLGCDTVKKFLWGWGVGWEHKCGVMCV